RVDEAKQWFERSDRATAALHQTKQTHDGDPQAQEETIEIEEEDVPLEDDHHDTARNGEN
ncbi:MAG: hypothetical protein ABI275_05055, partial [Terrimesophilobacter sp.]